MIVPDKGFFTTGEIALLSGFSQTTIQRCIDEKQIKFISIPGRRGVKVTRAALIQFLKDMGHEIEDQT